jgi:hypothetical protein
LYLTEKIRERKLSLGKLRERREAKGEGIQKKGRGEPRKRLALLCKNDG